MILMLSVHPSRFPDLLTEDRMRLDPPIPTNTYHDSFGNFCHVISAPAGRLTLSTDFLVHDNGEPDAAARQAEQYALEDLPVEALIYLLRVTFSYAHASPTKTAYEAYVEGRGVCRDFAHLAVTLCRCMNVPARYCTGYLGDIGVSPDNSPMDFSAWFEVYLGGRWYAFDARHNTPRIGRILMARGRDATDVAIVTSFGPCTLAGFKVITDEVTSAV
jgi:transglutaminase-like putative cysteine protease